jgi:cell division inhibitor SulA
MTTSFKMRKLKISSKFHKAKWKTSLKPKLTLSGDWLQKAGFEIGEHVTISVSKDLLIIQAIKP